MDDGYKSGKGLYLCTEYSSLNEKKILTNIKKNFLILNVIIIK